MKHRLLVLTLMTALAPGLGAAQTPAPSPAPAPAAQPDFDWTPRPAAAPKAAAAPDPAVRKELDQARRELERASERVAELTQKFYREDIERALLRPAFERPVIGIVMSPDEGEGVRLAAVTPQSPAAKAGLRGGDRLLRINGQAVGGKDDDDRLNRARELIGTLEEGEQVRLAYQRDGQTLEVTLKAESMPGLVWWRGEGDATPEAIAMRVAPLVARGLPMEIGPIAPMAAFCAEDEDCEFGPLLEAFRWRGLRLAALDAQLGRYFGSERGVLVLTKPGDELAGLEPGDVILSVDGEPVDTPREAMRQLREKAPGSRIDMQFLRDRKRQSMQFDAPKMARFPLMPPPPTPPVPPAPPAPPAPMKSLTPPPAPPAPPAPTAPPEPRGERGVLEKVWSS